RLSGVRSVRSGDLLRRPAVPGFGNRQPCAEQFRPPVPGSALLQRAHTDRLGVELRSDAHRSQRPPPLRALVPLEAAKEFPRSRRGFLAEAGRAPFRLGARGGLTIQSGARLRRVPPCPVTSTKRRSAGPAATPFSPTIASAGPIPGTSMAASTYRLPP